MPPPRPVTSRDVAHGAGVSRATVSYVLNGVSDQRISPSTRARVLAEAERLGYAPNAAARTLRDGRTDLVLIANPQWALGPLVAGAVTAAVERFTEQGMTPMLAMGTAATGEQFVRACQRIRPRGVLAPASELSEATLRSLRSSGVEAVVALGDRAKRGVPTSVFDQRRVGTMAVEHLLGVGHRSVLGVGPTTPALERTIADGRFVGARTTALAAGVGFEELRVSSRSELPGALRERLARPALPSALFAYNDEFAMAAIHVLQGAGLTVPDDMAVIGCDDIPAAEYFSPALTTLAPDASGAYVRAADALMDLVNGVGSVPARMTSPIQLRRRESA